MRLKRSVLQCGFAVVVASPVFAGWDGSSATSTGSLIDVSCNEIVGTQGVLTDWTHSVASAVVSSEDGVVGAQWEGHRYPLCPSLATPSTHQATVTHEFKPNASHTRNKFRVTLTVDAGAAGAATPDLFSDPSWWWTPTVSIMDSAPTIVRIHQNGSEQNVNFTGASDSYELAFAVGTSTLSPNGSTATAGVVAGAGGALNTSADMTTAAVSTLFMKSLEVRYKVYSTVNRTSDNAAVTGWQVDQTSTLTTTVSM